jgi:hypothetical protein
MTAGWNFERRRDTCARFLIGVALLAKGRAAQDTSLEAVRHAMRLSPEEALFAARRLSEEEWITFEPGGAVRSNARGIERSAEMLRDVGARAQRFDDVAAALRVGGAAVTMFAAAIRATGGALACGSPDADADGAYRLVLVSDVVTLERRGDDGSFAAAPVADGARANDG